MAAGGELWQVLQLSDVLDMEFATALAEASPVLLWEPSRSILPFRPWFKERPRMFRGSSLQIRRFPLLRGFWRSPLSFLTRFGPGLAARLAAQASSPERSVLVCTTPHFAPVAEQWPGPVVYWLTDMMVEYEGVNPGSLRELDRRLCRVARLVCPNSQRLAEYLREQAGCAEEKIEILPNATRRCNVLDAPLWVRTELPDGLRNGPEPLAGVLGALGGNMDWEFLERLLELTPWLSWLFVGPADLVIKDARQRAARAAVMRHKNTRFTGPRPYGELYRYARAFSVAVLPYRRREPTYSGSSTRFYEHLAAGHPMIATPGVAELLDKQPLLKLVETPEAAAEELEVLRDAGFGDGLRERRWAESQSNTWSDRAAAMRTGLSKRL